MPGVGTDGSVGGESGGAAAESGGTGSGPLVWDRMDSAKAESHHLVVVSAP